MEAVIYIVIGVTIGVIVSLLLFSRLRIGTLRIGRDEDGFEYPYLEYNSHRDRERVSKCSYVVLKVGQGVDLSQK